MHVFYQQFCPFRNSSDYRSQLSTKQGKSKIPFHYPELFHYQTEIQIILIQIVRTSLLNMVTHVNMYIKSCLLNFNFYLFYISDSILHCFFDAIEIWVESKREYQFCHVWLYIYIDSRRVRTAIIKFTHEDRLLKCHPATSTKNIYWELW